MILQTLDATTNTQTNTSGSNTTISGGYSQNQQRFIKVGHHQIQQLQILQTYSGDSRVVNSSSTLSMSAMSQRFVSLAYQQVFKSLILGFSGGTYRTDENCERIKLSKVLNDLVSSETAVSILC